MKKIIILLSYLLFISNVNALENNLLNDDIVIKYKWYQEETVDELYYPKKDKLDDYLEDTSLIEYGEYSTWDPKYCSYSSDNYLIESKVRTSYSVLQSTRYIKFSNLSIDDISKVNIFSDKNIVNFEIISNVDNNIIIKLNEIYNTDTLWFYIDLDKEYLMTLSYYEDFRTESLSKTINNIKLIIPDYKWKTSKTAYNIIITEGTMNVNSFTMIVARTTLCRVKEIKTYRYKVNKTYYDDNYYEYVDNYLPDINDYIVDYNGELPTNIIETIKVIQNDVKEKEYIYLNDNQSEYLESDTKENESNPNNLSCVSTSRLIERNIIKEKDNSSRNRLIIFIFILIAIMTIINLMIILKKKVD